MRDRQRRLDWLGTGLRLTVGVVLLVAGALKVANPAASALAVRAYQLLPYDLAGSVGYALPVVAFDAGGIKDWLIDGHNGRLVPWMDRNAYAGAIDQLLKNKDEARRLGENGLQLVSERYDFDQYIRDLQALFAEAAAERRENSARELHTLATP